jgi:hypothetical protein
MQDENDVSNSDSLKAKIDEEDEDAYNVSDDENTDKSSPCDVINKENSDKNDSDDASQDENKVSNICMSVLNNILTQVENANETVPVELMSDVKKESTDENSLSSDTSKKSKRRKRSAQELLEDSLSNKDALSPKRLIKSSSQFIASHNISSQRTKFSADSNMIKVKVEENSNKIAPRTTRISTCSNESTKQSSQTDSNVSVRASARIRGASSSHTKISPVKIEPFEPKQQKMSLITVRVCNNRKIHVCEKCGLEFTSGNSVLRHQEKSCLRVRVINLKSSSKGQQKEAILKKKCPICSSIFFNTHRLSIHIYKHHRNLLGNANKPPTSDARRLNEIQLKKLGLGSQTLLDDGISEENEEREEIEEEMEDDMSSDEASLSDSSSSSRQISKKFKSDVSNLKKSRIESSDSIENSNIPSDNCTLEQANLSVSEGVLDSVDSKLNMTC